MPELIIALAPSIHLVLVGPLLFFKRSSGYAQELTPTAKRTPLCDVEEGSGNLDLTY
jgi:hypothetical protein